MVAFVASTVLTAANLNSAFNALTIRTVTGTSDTLVLADNGGAVTYDNASATTSTIPPFSSVAYAVGTKIVLANLGAGTVTVTAGAGVTVNGTSLAIAQNAGGTCLKTATNTWQFLPFGSAGAATLTSADVTSTTGSPTITTSGIYTIYQFTGSGTIVLGKAGLCDALVIGGGGGGGPQTGGGGGAGGYNEQTAYLPSGTNTVTVGAGGAGTVTGSLLRYVNGYNGLPSTVGQRVIGVGGGGGAAAHASNVAPTGGGSGGGGAYNFAGAAGFSGQGNSGGAAGGGATGSAGGGGGASANGVAGISSGAAGAGGAGTASSITGSSVTRGGGGGGGVAGNTAGAGGSGGGAAGTNNNTQPTAATINTGGGGGGGGNASSYGANGGNGGSGVVIIKVVT